MRLMTIHELIDGLAKTSPSERANLREEIVEVSKTAIPRLITAVQKEGKESYQAACFLADLAPEVALPVLLEAAHSRNIRLARMSIELLGTLGDVQAVPVLLELLNHHSTIIQMSAIQSLECLGTSSAQV
jgi:HEAT repeat protein